MATRRAKPSRKPGLLIAVARVKPVAKSAQVGNVYSSIAACRSSVRSSVRQIVWRVQGFPFRVRRFAALSLLAIACGPSP